MVQLLPVEPNPADPLSVSLSFWNKKAFYLQCSIGKYPSILIKAKHHNLTDHSTGETH